MCKLHSLLWVYCLQGAHQGHEDLLKVHVIIRDLLKKVRSYPPESLGNTIAGKSTATGISHVVVVILKTLSNCICAPCVGALHLGFKRPQVPGIQVSQRTMAVGGSVCL